MLNIVAELEKIVKDRVKTYLALKVYLNLTSVKPIRRNLFGATVTTR